MDTIGWLSANAPGFSDLPNEDRQAIFHFSFLWSLFEGTALDTHASARAIRELVHRWDEQHQLDDAAFAPSLVHFKERYFKNGVTTDHFSGLKLRSNDDRELVEAVLKGENTNAADTVSALLIIVYRLRNNLFHGTKWSYGIRDQLDNFTHANASLMTALDIDGRL